MNSCGSQLSPSWYFHMIFTDAIINNIVAATNLFDRGKSSDWQETNAREILEGIQIYLRHNRVVLSYDSGLLTLFPYFVGGIITDESRYADLCRFVRFEESHEEIKGENEEIDVVQPLIARLRQQFRSVYTPTQNLTIFASFITTNTSDIFADLYELHDETNFVCDLIVEKSNLFDSYQQRVAQLIEPQKGKGHRINVEGQSVPVESVETSAYQPIGVDCEREFDYFDGIACGPSMITPTTDISPLMIVFSYLVKICVSNAFLLHLRSAPDSVLSLEEFQGDLSSHLSV